MMEEAVARPLREQQAEAERRRAFQCDRDNFPNGRGPCPKCGSYNTKENTVFDAPCVDDCNECGHWWGFDEAGPLEIA